jgi:O-antigen/teichoic acid export membrane protein
MRKIGKFGLNVVTLGIGSIISQSINLLFYPILGRLFSPNDFGVLSSITVISSLIMVLATGKYEQSIIITNNKIETANVLALSLLLSFFCCLLLLILLPFFSNTISLLLNSPDISNILYLSPLIAFFITVYNCYNEWCVKDAFFSQLSANKIYNSASTGLSKFFCYYAKIGNGLIWGELFGRFVSALLAIINILRKDSLLFRKHVSVKRMVAMMKKYKDFPRFTMPDQLINTLSGSLPMFFIMRYYGAKEYGYFSMVQLVLSFPVTLIGQSVMDVFRKQASVDYMEKGNCREIFKKVFKILGLITVIFFVPIYFSMPIVFSLFLGIKWKIAGAYAQIILPVIALSFIYSILSGVWIIANKLRQRFYWQIFYCFMLLFSLIAGSLIIHNIDYLLFFYTVSMCIIYGVGILFLNKYSK